MKNCLELKLGISGVVYIRECLEYGKALSKQLLTLIDQNQGEVVAILPQDLNTEKLSEATTEFRYGGITREGGTLACLVTIIQEFLNENSSHICLIEDTVFRREDWLSSSNHTVIELPMLFFENDVYYFLSNSDHSNSEKIRRTISTLDRHLVTGVLTSLPSGENIPNEKQDISLTDINDFALEVEVIITDAYDGEGYLIWRRI